MLVIMKSRLTGRLRRSFWFHSPPFRNATAHGPSARAARSMDMAVKAVLLVIYLIGAICTAWCLSVPTVSREHRSFLRICFVIWPFIVTVFGVFVLLALLAHWYDRLDLAPTGHRADFQQSPAAAATPDPGKRLPGQDTCRSGRWSEV